MSAHQHFEPDPDWPPIVELARERWGDQNRGQSQRDDIRFGAKGSKSVKPSANTWHDHETGEGGGYIEMYRATRGELPPRRTGDGALPAWQDIATTYDYRDADGALVFQVVRTFSGNPRFRQRKPSGNAKKPWIWTVKDIPAADRPLYRLSELRASGTQTVWIPEGEKDVDRLAGAGLVATTNSGGVGKWHATYVEEFRGKHCVLDRPTMIRRRSTKTAGRAFTPTVGLCCRARITPGSWRAASWASQPR